MTRGRAPCTSLLCWFLTKWQGAAPLVHHCLASLPQDPIYSAAKHRKKILFTVQNIQFVTKNRMNITAQPTHTGWHSQSPWQALSIEIKYASILQWGKALWPNTPYSWGWKIFSHRWTNLSSGFEKNCFKIIRGKSLPKMLGILLYPYRCVITR